MLSSRAHTFAVLASGNGTNFEALACAAASGSLGGEIAVLVSDRDDAPVLERARRLGVQSLVLPGGRFRTRIEDERPWVAALRSRGVDTVLLAGFMRRLHTTFLAAFADRILNVHPSLLPAYAGLEPIRRAWQDGVATTGCTVHVVDAELDHGPIVDQAAVENRAGEPLAALEARIHEAEHALYPRAVQRFVTVPWRREAGRLVFAAGAEVAS